MRNRMYGGVRGRKTKVGRKLSFSSYSINEKYQLLSFYSVILFVEGLVLSINQRRDTSLCSDHVLNKVNDRLIGFIYFSDSLFVFKQELSFIY